MKFTRKACENALLIMCMAFCAAAQADPSMSAAATDKKFDSELRSKIASAGTDSRKLDERICVEIKWAKPDKQIFRSLKSVEFTVEKYIPYHAIGRIKISNLQKLARLAHIQKISLYPWAKFFDGDSHAQANHENL